MMETFGFLKKLKLRQGLKVSSIAIIPARGGSKRIPRKNIRSFHGKPMIVWSIEAAKKAGVFDAVIVSTDNDEIASIAASAGADVPFRRPNELSGDHSATMPVVTHAIKWWEENRIPIELACCIYATAPFVRPEDLVKGIEMLRDSTADFVLAITRFDYPVQRALKLNDKNMLSFAEPENALIRSQDLEPRFHDAGQFFAGKRDAFASNEAVLFGRCLPLLLEKEQAIDIDDEKDWKLAEKLFSFMGQ